MDDLDKQLLDAVQDEIPLVERPFAEIASRLGIDEAECLERIKAMAGDGVFRRVGASFSPQALGFRSTLAAARVAPDRIDEAAAVLRAIPEITHNYERAGHGLNMWFTIIAQSEARIAAILDGIARDAPVEELVELPVTHRYKTRVHFGVRDRQT